MIRSHPGVHSFTEKHHHGRYLTSTLLNDMAAQEEPELLHPFEDEVEFDDADSDTVILDEDEDFDYWNGGDFEDDVIANNDELMDRDVRSYLAFLSQNHAVRAREE